MVGSVYGKWTVLAEGPVYIDPGTSRKRQTWLCRCDCGTTRVIHKRMFGKASKSCVKCVDWSAVSSRGPRGPHKTKRTKPGESGLNSLFRTYMTHARKRNHGWSLTKDDFGSLTSSSCHYCGIEPRQNTYTACKYESARKHAVYTHNGVDRKDNTIGYNIETASLVVGAVIV